MFPAQSEAWRGIVTSSTVRQALNIPFSPALSFRTVEVDLEGLKGFSEVYNGESMSEPTPSADSASTSHICMTGERCSSRLDTLPECASCEERSPIRLSAAENSDVGCCSVSGRSKKKHKHELQQHKEHDFQKACCGDVRMGRLVYICLVSSLKRLRDSYVACMLMAASNSRSHAGLVMGHHFFTSTSFYPSSRFDDDVLSQHGDDLVELSNFFGSFRSSFSDSLRKWSSLAVMVHLSQSARTHFSTMWWEWSRTGPSIICCYDIQGICTQISRMHNGRVLWQILDPISL